MFYGTACMFSTFSRRNAKLHMLEQEEKGQALRIERLPRSWWGRVALLLVLAIGLVLVGVHQIR